MFRRRRNDARAVSVRAGEQVIVDTPVGVFKIVANPTGKPPSAEIGWYCGDVVWFDTRDDPINRRFVFRRAKDIFGETDG